MGVIAQFDYASWVARYREFKEVDEDLVTLYFQEATLYHANDGSGPVADSTQQLQFLNMLTAHICKLNAVVAGVEPSKLVGRVSSASQGSISVQTDNQYPPGTPQWFQQTSYGSAYWAVTARYRTMKYRASPGRFMQPAWPIGSWRI